MIYVLKSAGYDSNDNFINLIKIGFSDHWDKRSTAYRLHNPTIKVLFEIEGGNELDEVNLHNYFNNYKFPDYGNEWFVYDENIIDFFKANNSIDLIREIVFDTVNSRKSISYPYIRKISEIIFEITASEEVYLKDIIKDMNSYNLRDINSVLFYIRTKYKECADKIIDSVVSWHDRLNNLSEEDKILLKSFSLENTQKDKMKFLCNMDGISRSRIIDLIPQYYKNFIEALGPDKCKSLSYDYVRMKAAMSVKYFDKNKLVERIGEEFHEGDRIARVDIKERLAKIYDELQYQETPKANDLEEWFEVKDCQVLVNGKRSRGYELLRKKF